MKARVHISLKPGVLDPQGKAIGNALKGLGFSDVGEVRQGKLIELEVAQTDPAAARARVEEMCKQLLANPVIENYAIEIGGVCGPSPPPQPSPACGGGSCAAPLATVKPSPACGGGKTGASAPGGWGQSRWAAWQFCWRSLPHGARFYPRSRRAAS